MVENNHTQEKLSTLTLIRDRKNSADFAWLSAQNLIRRNIPDYPIEDPRKPKSDLFSPEKITDEEDAKYDRNLIRELFYGARVAYISGRERPEAVENYRKLKRKLLGEISDEEFDKYIKFCNIFEREIFEVKLVSDKKR